MIFLIYFSVSLTICIIQNTLDETKQELNALKIEHAPCPNLIAALRDELEKFKVANAELKVHLARLDKKLAAELEKEEKLKRSDHGFLDIDASTYHTGYQMHINIICCRL